MHPGCASHGTFVLKILQGTTRLLARTVHYHMQSAADMLDTPTPEQFLSMQNSERLIKQGES